MSGNNFNLNLNNSSTNLPYLNNNQVISNPASSLNSANQISFLPSSNDSWQSSIVNPQYISWDQTLKPNFANAIEKLRNNTSLVSPDDKIGINPENGHILIIAADGTVKKSIDGSNPDNLNLFFPFNSQISSSITESSNPNDLIQIGDKLIFDEKTGKFKIERNGKEIDPSGNLAPVGLNEAKQNQINSPNVQAEVQRISSAGQTFSALNISHGLTTSPIDVNGLVPGLGDQTGATIAAGIYAQAGLYTQLQKTIAIINELNTAPSGTTPNINFSYIAGRPPYGQDTPEGRAAQNKVFAQLRTNIIAQLTRVSEQLQAASAGLKQQTDLAEKHKGNQDSTVSNFIKQAFEKGG